MNRSPAMQKFVDGFAQSAFGRTNSEAIDTNTCVSCGLPVGEFRDRISQKEYNISGLCQKCQDSVFGE